MTEGTQFENPFSAQPDRVLYFESDFENHLRDAGKQDVSLIDVGEDWVGVGSFGMSFLSRKLKCSIWSSSR
jgi:hypothetical protein